MTAPLMLLWWAVSPELPTIIVSVVALGLVLLLLIILEGKRYP